MLVKCVGPGVAKKMINTGLREKENTSSKVPCLAFIILL